MKKIEVYANYGVLAHEKQTVYTYSAEHPHAVTSEVLIVCIPDSAETAKNNMGELLLTPPDGYTYTVNELLASTADGKPCFRYVGKDGGTRTVLLDIVS